MTGVGADAGDCTATGAGADVGDGAVTEAEGDATDGAGAEVGVGTEADDSSSVAAAGCGPGPTAGAGAAEDGWGGGVRLTMRTSRVVPLGSDGSDEVTMVAGMPGEGGGRDSCCTGAGDETGAEDGAVAAVAGVERMPAGPTGLSSMASRRHCGCAPPWITVMSSLAPGAT